MGTDPLRTVLECVRRTAPLAGGATDGQCLAEFLARRDEAAFAALVRRHGPMVLGLCRRILRHAQDAEDVFQAVFLVLARKAATIRKRESVADWLYGVARRTAMKARTAAARRRAREVQVANVPHPLTAAPAGEEWRPLLDEELARLPEKYRLPVILCELEGRTRRQAARQLDLPEGTLSSRLATARKLLAGRLARRGLTLSAAAVGPLLAREAAAAEVPAVLADSTVQAATLSGTAPAAATALAEGVVQAMLLTRLKIATALVVLALSIATVAIPIYQAQAQQPGGGPGARSDKDLAKEVAELRREVDRLRRRLGERDRLNRQQEEALATIGRGLKMLRVSMAGDRERGAAIDVFEKAYRVLSDQFHGREKQGDVNVTWPVQPRVIEVREVLPGGLVTLTVTNAGLRRGQVLSVLRLGPGAAYLGRIEIVDVQGTLAVGKAQLQPGEQIRPRDRLTLKDQQK